jgi:hypothetical protein
MRERSPLISSGNNDLASFVSEVRRSVKTLFIFCTSFIKRILSGFSTAGSKFLSIVRRAWMVSAGDNGIYTSSGL